MDAVVVGAENSHPSKCLLVRDGPAFALGLIRLSPPRQTGPLPHVFFIQTRQGRANLAPPLVFICRPGASCLGGSTVTGGGLSSTGVSDACDSCMAAGGSGFGASNFGISGIAAG